MVRPEQEPDRSDAWRSDPSRSDPSRSDPSRAPKFAMVAMFAFVVTFVAVLAWVSFDRSVFNYNTETDYLGSFTVEAERLLAGEPLEIRFHPPLYAAVLAGARSLGGDWLAVGLWVSLLASLASLVLAALLMRRILGFAAGLGAAVLLALSPTFVHFSMQATSESFGLAMYLAAFFAVVLSATRGRPWDHLLAGLIVALALLARTNHIALLGLGLLYLVSPPRRAHRADEADAPRAAPWLALVGLAVPLVAWTVFATATGAPLTPTNNHENFALTYFSDGGRISGDERLALADEFTSTIQVLTADPVRIARIYVRDFATTTYRLLVRESVVPFPVVLLGALGWLLILVRERRSRAFLLVVLLNLAAMYLVLNFKACEDRYYLFVLPLVGAGIGYAAAFLLGRASKGWPRWLGAGLLGALVVIAGAWGWTEAARLHAEDWAEDASAAAAYLSALDEGQRGVVFARKPHNGYYGGLDDRMFPDVDGFDALAADLDAAIAETGSERAFVFYGAAERDTRPQFDALSDAEGAADAGLVLVARGPVAGGWTLFERTTP